MPKFMVLCRNSRRAGDLVAKRGVATGSAADSTDGVGGRPMQPDSGQFVNDEPPT